MTCGEIVIEAHKKLLPELPPMTGIKQLLNEIVNDICNRDWSFLRKEYQFSTVAEYDTGTVAVTNGSTTVTGTGTTFTSAMVGRKIRTSGNEVYEIASFTSSTIVELTTEYAGDTESGISYIIFQDEYSMPSDMRALLGVWDQTNGYAQEVVQPKMIADLQQWSQFTGTFTNFIAGWRRDSSDNAKILFYPYPSSAALYKVWYIRIPTRITGPNSTPDIPSSLHDAIVLGLVSRTTRNKTDIGLYKGEVDKRLQEDQQIPRGEVIRPGRKDLVMMDPFTYDPSIFASNYRATGV